MACNVFGTPVTIETLKGMPEYADKQKITRSDLAEVAYSLKNAEGKDMNARTYVENMSKMFKDNKCVLGVIYNATGEVLRYGNIYNWYGIVSPAPYPAYIENGQWGAFVFVQKGDGGAHGSVIYRGFDFRGDECDFFVGWDNASGNQQSKVCVDIGVNDTFSNLGSDNLSKKVVNSGQYSWLIKDKLLSTAIISGSDQVAVVEVIHRRTLPSPIADS